jgi:hypothetical protein
LWYFDTGSVLDMYGGGHVTVIAVVRVAVMNVVWSGCDVAVQGGGSSIYSGCVLSVAVILVVEVVVDTAVMVVTVALGLIITIAVVVHLVTDFVGIRYYICWVRYACLVLWSC